MKTRFLAGIGVLTTLLIASSPSPAHAGTFTHNFNADPSADMTFLGTAKWVGAGSFDGSGYVSLTDAEGGQGGMILLPDLDAGAAISGFTASMKLRIGGGTPQAADGLSLSFASAADDPDLSAGNVLTEEGTSTGLVIALDSFDNGGEAPALDVKLDGVLLVRQRFNGQGTLTGPVFKDSQGREQILGTIDKFEDLVVTLKPDGALTVKWRGFDIYVNLPTGFRPRAGQFALAARTGGLWDNHWLDELSITTSTAPAAGPWVKSYVPKAGYTAMGGTPITFEIQDGSGTSLNPATIVLKFDSVEIPVTPTKVGNVTTISYDPPGVLATESTHQVELTFSDNGTPTTASVYSFGFTVSNPFTPDTLFIEAEDFNFGHGDWVKDRPTGMSGPYPGDAYQDLGTGIDGTLGDGTDLGIDYFEVTAGNALPADQNGGNRPGTGVEAGKRNGPAGFARAGFDVTVNYAVGWNDVGDWLNFTRQFPTLPLGRGYKVWARLASGDQAEAAQLDIVTSGATTTTQTLSKVGEFRSPASGGWDSWHLVAMKDATGGETFLKISGLKTLRFTTLPGTLDFDYLALVPQDVPILRAFVSANTPGAGGTALPAQPITATITDRDTAVVPSTIKLFVDDVDVTTAATITDTADGATVRFSPPSLFAAGSAHRVKVQFDDNSTPAESISSEWTFTVSNYRTVPPIFATGAGQVNKSQPGFRVRVHQMTVGRGPGDPNWVQNGERQLADGFIDSATGLPYPNVAQPGTDPDGWFTIPDIINWSGDAGVERGFYTSANNFPDAPVPGIPGTTDSTDWFAAEIITYLELKAGTYRFVVNSDDGFKLSTGPHAREALGVILGQFNGGRGASDTIFDVYVEADGIYPFRLAWWEGGGESNVEFAVIDLATGNRTLINDLSAAGAIKAYAQRSGAPPYVASVSPEVNAVIVPPDAPITARIVDGATVQVDPDSVVVSLDGVVQERAVSKTGNSTSVRVVPANIYASGSTHRVTLSYSELGAPLNVHTGSWDFTVLGYVVLPPELASPIGSGNANERGFKIRIHQTGSGASAGGALYNRNSRAEAQLRGLIPTGDGSLLPNVASGEFFTDADVINWNQDAPAAVGNFNVDNGKEDELIPGIPGTTSSTDNIAGELLTYVEFPNVGIYTMGVNSDDGFRVSPAEAAGRDGALHISEPASLAGLYLAIEGGANWCRPLWEIGTVSGELVLADPVQACQRLLNAGAVAGKIVVVDRGTCRFDNKGAHAELAGAIACIVVNNNPGMPIEMGGDPNEGARVILGVARRLNIPVVQIRPQDGNLIKAALTAGTRVVASLGYETLTIGTFDGGRGASDSTFTFFVAQPGVYPFRCLWYEGEGGANLEWFSVTKSEQKVLLNDSTNPVSLKAFRSRTAVQPRPQITKIQRSGGNVIIEWTGGGTLEVSDKIIGGSWSNTGLTSPASIPESTITGQVTFGRIKR